MQQNTENTIGRFRAAMASAEGFARPSRFAVRIFPPSSLNQLTNTIGRQVNIMCDTVTMPGVDLQTQEIQYGSEPARNHVTSHGFAGNIVATFMQTNI